MEAIRKPVKLKKIKVNQQGAIVNGQPINQVVEVYAIICPHCNNVIATYPLGTPFQNVCSNYESLGESLKYCSTCGKPLKFVKQLEEVELISEKHISDETTQPKPKKKKEKQTNEKKKD